METTAAPLDADLVRLADTLRALAHPARLRLLRILSERGTCVCGVLVDELPLAQSTVSQHLKVLREAGLVAGEAEGTRSCYCIDAAAVAEAARQFGALAAGLTASACAEGGCEC